MGLKQILRKSFAWLRTKIRSILQRISFSSRPSSDGLSPSGPQPLHGPWEEGWVLDVYRHKDSTQRSEIGRLLWRYKYRGRIDLADKLADYIVTLIGKVPRNVDGIVIVPPSVARLYDPLYLLGQTLARRLGIPFYAGLLTKTRPTARHKDMRTRAQKRANVAGAFAVCGDVRGRSLLVLDDLYDSGETLKEVTRVLKRAGVRWVGVITLVRTRRGERL
jgi:hypothetical protein